MIFSKQQGELERFSKKEVGLNVAATIGSLQTVCYRLRTIEFFLLQSCSDR